MVESLLAGRSMLLVAPDHRLNSLAWWLAAALGRRPVLVVTSSARGLARRADEIANRARLVTCRLDAEMPGTGLTALRDQLRAGRWDAALVSARHLGDPRVMDAARALRPKLLVVEDAHCLSRHGHRFDPCYRHAAALADDTDCVLALSDVADRTARNGIADALDISEDPAIDLDLPDLRLEIRNTPGRSKRDSQLLSLMNAAPERAVVFVGMRVEAERIARMIEDHCRLPALNLTSRGGDEFAARLRRFREGSARVLVATGALTAAERWPPVPLVAVHSLPESPEMLHRQARFATGDGARAVLLYDRTEYAALERNCLRCAPEVGHLLAIRAAILDEQRIDYTILSNATGLHPQEVHLGVEMLVAAGEMAVRRRGDDWLEADLSEPLDSAMLTDCARSALMLRRARLEKAERLLTVARSRSCRRVALGRALDYDVVERRCECDRCEPEAGDTL